MKRVSLLLAILSAFVFGLPAVQAQVPKVYDRVQQFTTTTGTGDLTLGSTPTGYISFGSKLLNGEKTYYGVYLPGTNEYEIGIGTYNSTGGTISRTTVLQSSNSDALVNFSAGAKLIFMTNPSALVNTIPGLTPQTAGTFYGGPATGPPANPAFRALASTDLPATAVTPGSYTNTNLTVDQYGRITAASSGSAGGTFPFIATTLSTPVVAPLATSGTHKIIFGDSAISTSVRNGDIVIGDGASSVNTNTGPDYDGNVAIGYRSKASGNGGSSGGSVALGAYADARAEASVAIGFGVTAGINSIAIGMSAPQEYQVGINTKPGVSMLSNTDITYACESNSTTQNGSTLIAAGAFTKAVGVTSMGFHSTGSYLNGESSGSINSLNDSAGGKYSMNFNSIGIQNRSYLATWLGQYNNPIAATAQTTYSGTGLAFGIGNGTSKSAISNAFELYYDGKLKANGHTILNSGGSLNIYDGLPDTTGRSGDYLQTLNGTLQWSGVSAGGGGTVTSVAMTVPSMLTVTGSPVTGSGTLAVTWNNQNGNVVLASPGDGSLGQPLFRVLGNADLPVINIAHGGTGQTSAQAGLDALLPSQTSNSGKVLTTNGTTASWAIASNPYIAIPTTTPSFSPSINSNAANCMAFGSNAQAGGATTTNAVAINNAASTGNYSIAIGGTSSLGQATASGTNAVALGRNATSSGTDAFAAMGATASNTESFAAGVGALAQGVGDIVMGHGPSATGTGTAHRIVIGYNNSVVPTTATGDQAVVLQVGTASGTLAQCLTGYNSTASGFEATVLGGEANTASGKRAVTLGGTGITATAYGQVVWGQFNTLTPASASSTYTATDPALIIGNGTGTGARSNALEFTFDNRLTIGGVQHTFTNGKMMGKFNYTSGAINTNYTVLSTDVFVVASTTTATVTVTLPQANAVQSGKILVIKDIGANAATNNITISRAAADNIDGATTSTISTNYGMLRLVSDGTANWYSW